MSAARSCAARVAALALLAAPSAWAQWLVGPEVDPCPAVSGGAWSHANAVAAASDGRSWFVAWQDARASADFDAVYGARVALDGSVLDPIGVPIARTAGHVLAPAVAFDGEHFVAAWFQTGAAAPYVEDAYAARIASDGTLLDPTPIVLARALRTSFEIRAVRDARGVLVAWWDASRGLHAPLIYGEHLAPDGTLVEPAPVALVTGPTCQGQFDLAFDGAHTLLAWEDCPCASPGGFCDAQGHVLATRLDATLAALDAPPLSMPGGDQFGPRVGCTGAACLVVWNPTDGEFGEGVAAARVSRDGVLEDTTALTLADDPTAREPGPVGALGDAFFATWTRGPDAATSQLLGTRIDASGAVGDAPLIAPTGTLFAESSPFVSAGPTGLWVASGGYDQSGPLLATRVTSAGTLLDVAAFDVATSANPTRAPAVVRSDDGYLATWLDDRGGVGVAPLDDAGRVLPGAGARVPGSGSAAGAPTVARVTSGYVVAWHERLAGVAFARLALDGTPRDAAPTRFVVPDWAANADAFDGPHACAVGDRATIAWSLHRFSGIDGVSVVQVARVDAGDAGVAALAVPPIAGTERGPRGPGVATNGAITLAAWFAGDGLRAARYGADGTLLDTTSLAIADGGWNDAAPVVASDGHDFLLAWRATTDASASLKAVRVGADGRPIDLAPFVVEPGVSTDAQVAVAFDGSRYHVVWSSRDAASGPTLAEVSIDPGNPTGRPAPQLLPATAFPAHAPALAFAAPDRGVLAYERFDDAAPFGSVRVRARVLTSPDAPPSSDAGTAATPDATPVNRGAPSGCGCAIDRPVEPTDARAWVVVSGLAAAVARRRGAPGKLRRRRGASARDTTHPPLPGRAR